MKYVSLAIGIFIAWVMLASAQLALAEELVERTFEINGVEQIHLQGSGNLELRIGDKETLVVIAPTSVMEKIEVNAKADVLRIQQDGTSSWSWKNLFNKNSNKVIYKLTLKKLSSISASGGIEVVVMDPIKHTEFHINLSGASTLEVPHLELEKALSVDVSGASNLDIKQFKAPQINLEGSGASNVTIAGLTHTINLEVSGASEFHGRHLQTQKASINASGASTAKLWVEAKLSGEASGASDISYYGNPTTDIDSSGASEITKNSDKP